MLEHRGVRLKQDVNGRDRGLSGREDLFPVVLHAFFFQAEDGIRDTSVTGVQTCALPICRRRIAAELLDVDVLTFGANEDLNKGFEAAAWAYDPPYSSGAMKVSRDVVQAKLLPGIARPSNFAD